MKSSALIATSQNHTAASAVSCSYSERSNSCPAVQQPSLSMACRWRQGMREGKGLLCSVTRGQRDGDASACLPASPTQAGHLVTHPVSQTARQRRLPTVLPALVLSAHALPCRAITCARGSYRSLNLTADHIGSGTDSALRVGSALPSTPSWSDSLLTHPPSHSLRQ